MWRTDQVRIELVNHLTDHPVTTLNVHTPDGLLVVMAELSAAGGTLHADRLHIHAVGVGPNGLGPAKLRRVARIVMEVMGYERLVIAGAARTTGAGPGDRPRQLRFARLAPPDDQATW